METFIRKQLRMKSHHVVQIEESDNVMIAHVERIGRRQLVCSRCRLPCNQTQGRLQDRTWQDLNLRNIVLKIRYRSFRVCCPRCRKVKIEKVPWAEPWSRITMALAAAVALLARKLSWLEVACHFGLDWKTVAQIVRFAVAEGLRLRPWKPLHVIGIDEVSRRRGHEYLTLVYDLERSRIVWIGEKRKRVTIDSFFHWLNRRRGRSIQAVCCDMWAPYADSVRQHLPRATLVFDRFHLVRHLGEALNDVRIEEVRRLGRSGKHALKGTRFLLLKNPWNLTPVQRDSLFNLTRINRRLVRAYLLKESFQLFWSYRSPFHAKRFLQSWLWQAAHSRLDPIKQFARMVNTHIDGILAWTTLRISNGTSEGINNKVKLVSHRAFGFRTSACFMTAIYHVCANLPLPAWA
jgi:transposase